MHIDLDYSGPERRIRPVNDRRGYQNCFEHSGVVQRLENLEEKAEHFQNSDFLTTGTYWWTTGLLVSIIVAVLSAVFYLSFQAGETLREVKTSQTTLTYMLHSIQADVEDLKKRAKP